MKYAFVAMPFAPEHHWIYTELIVPPFRAAGWHIDRVDEEAHLELITKRVIEKIIEADLVIAVLTGYNRNVMYELGVSHAFRKPTLLLADKLDDLPFDLAQLRCLRYSDVQCQLVRDQIRGVIEELSAATLHSGNPVTSLVPDPFRVIFPVDPFDMLNLQCDMVIEKSVTIRSSGKRIKEIDKQTADLSLEEEGLFGTLRNMGRSLVLMFTAALLVRDLYVRASIIASEMPVLMNLSRQFVEKSRTVLPYNRNLYILSRIIKKIKEELTNIQRDQGDSAERIQGAFSRLDSKGLRRLLELVSKSVSLELFKGAWRDYDIKAEDFQKLCKTTRALQQVLEDEISVLTSLEEETIHRMREGKKANPYEAPGRQGVDIP